MKKLLLILAVLVLTARLASAQTNAPAATSETDQAITHLREGLVDSFNHGDIDHLLTFLSTNAIVTWQNGEVCNGPAAVKAYYERMMKGDHPVVKTVTADPQVLGRQIHGDWAVSWGNLHDHFVLNDGSELPLNSQFTATISRQGDRWLVTAFHLSVNAFDNPIMALAVKKVSLFAGLAGLIFGLVAGVAIVRLRQRSKSSGAT